MSANAKDVVLRFISDIWEWILDVGSPLFDGIHKTIHICLSIFSSLSPQTESRLIRTHGSFKSLALFIFLNPAYEHLNRMEDHIRWAGDPDIEKCVQTYLGECNMAAIAGTIIAQVALTSLSLPNLSAAHWIARAALLLSLISGCLAVFYASLLQRKLGNLRTASEIKSWWRAHRRSRSDTDWRSRSQRHQDPERTTASWRSRGQRRRSSQFSTESSFVNFQEYLQRLGTTPDTRLSSSVAAAVLMSAPTLMINWALGAFLTGIGIYFGFVWKNKLDALASQVESRNTFICFIIGLAFCSSFYGVPVTFKIWEDHHKTYRGYRMHDVSLTFEELYDNWNLIGGNPERRREVEVYLKPLLEALATRLITEDDWTKMFDNSDKIAKLIYDWNAPEERSGRGNNSERNDLLGGGGVIRAITPDSRNNEGADKAPKLDLELKTVDQNHTEPTSAADRSGSEE